MIAVPSLSTALVAATLAAGAPSDAQPTCGKSFLVATRATVAPELDGVLDDPVWAKACWINDFSMLQPRDGRPATRRTRAAVAYDDRFLYLAFAAFDAPADIRAHFAPRDSAYDDDLVGVLIDGTRDQLTAQQFLYNPYGVQMDATYAERTDREDDRWDAIQRSAGRIGPDRYVVEAAIDLSELRLPSDDGAWGFAFLRLTRHLDELDTWPASSLAVRGRLTQIGELRGVDGQRRGAGVRASAELVLHGGIDADGGRTGEQSQIGLRHADAGLGLRWAITPSLIASGTLNPDFSQVEADADQVENNLRFALLLDEKRPFFLGGLDLLQTSVNADDMDFADALYTRSIVRPIYGLKLAGTIGGTSIAVLHALDDAPLRSLEDLYAEDFAPPSTNAFVSIVRVKRDVLAHSHVGALLSNRVFADGSRVNTTGGADGSFGLGEHLVLDGQVLGSHTISNGAESADGFVTLESDYRARNYHWRAMFRDVGPDFISDVGFINRRNYRLYNFNGELIFRPDWSWLYVIEPMLHYGRYSDRTDLGLFDASLIDDDLHAHLYFEGALGSWLIVSAGHRQHRFHSSVQRTFFVGCGAGAAPTHWLSAEVSFQEANRWHYDDLDPFFGPSRELSATVKLKPFARLASEWSLSFFQLARPGTGAIVEQSLILRGVVRVFLLRDLHLRFIGEGNDEEGRFDASFLLAFEPSAGSAIYLGYEGRFPFDGPVGEQSGFAKLAWTW